MSNGAKAVQKVAVPKRAAAAACVYLMRWGFMNSVRTEPSTSVAPYSIRHSSPALKIMHTCSNGHAQLGQSNTRLTFQPIRP